MIYKYFQVQIKSEPEWEREVDIVVKTDDNVVKGECFKLKHKLMVKN